MCRIRARITTNLYQPKRRRQAPKKKNTKEIKGTYTEMLILGKKAPRTRKASDVRKYESNVRSFARRVLSSAKDVNTAPLLIKNKKKRQI